MSAEDLRLEQPAEVDRSWLRPVLAMAVPLAITWWVAFSITGIMWWRAQQPTVEQVPPPEPARLESVQADSIDLDLYRRANPYWMP